MGKKQKTVTVPSQGVTKSRFQVIIEGTPNITHCYQPGLQALTPNHRVKITPANTRDCEGSVDIDACTTVKYPQDSRWDYVIGYEGKAYFVEVHSAQTGEVSAVEKKLVWLKQWLTREAPDLNKIKVGFYWIQSSNNQIPSHLSQYRRLAQAGLLPVAHLDLPPK